MGERTAAKVCELRKKLMQASGGRDYIETIWGRGYALRDPELKGHTPQQSVRERPERSRSSRNAYRDMRGTDAEGVRCRYFGTRRSRQGRPPPAGSRATPSENSLAPPGEKRKYGAIYADLRW